MDGYSLCAKNEISALSFSTDCCKRAFLSAIVHTCGSLIFSRGGMKVTLSVPTKAFPKKIKAVLYDLFGDGVKAEMKSGNLVLSGEKLLPALAWLGIFSKSEEGELVVERGIRTPLIKEDCCAVNYLRGAFLGAGSMSLNGGYHLEIAPSSKTLAEDILKIMKRFGIKARLTERKEKHVVYIKDVEGVSDALALMGASEAMLELNSESIIRQFRRDTNRRTNCEIANISKTVNASVRQNESIRYIEKKVGLASLPEKLQAVAKARLEFPDESFSYLADYLGLSKSTLKNRLNKLGEIAQKIKEEND